MLKFLLHLRIDCEATIDVKESFESYKVNLIHFPLLQVTCQTETFVTARAATN